MSKFTPGPWELLIYKHPNMLDQPQYLKAKGINEKGALWIGNCGIKLEDAKLISIAPEMYTMLKDLISSLRRYEDEYSELGGRATDIEELLAKID